MTRHRCGTSRCLECGESWPCEAALARRENPKADTPDRPGWARLMADAVDLLIEGIER